MSLYAVLPLLSAAAVATFVRLVRGPSLPDRVVAFDLLSTVVIGMLAAYAVAMDLPVFLDVTIVLALLSFLGTVGFAFYLHKGA